MKVRIPETNKGIQGEITVKIFDEFSKYMRDKGWIETQQIIDEGIKNGHVLEIGCGPGIKGLEWLKNTKDTRLTAIEISNDMIRIAKKNAKEYGLENRVSYINRNATIDFGFEDNTFDAAFSTGSLHEWEYPEKVFNELYRVVKPEGKIFVSDMRRDVSWVMKTIVRKSTKPKALIPGFDSSLAASYTVEEINEIVKNTNIKNYEVKKGIFGLSIIILK